jgi:hypothetical protein
MSNTQKWMYAACTDVGSLSVPLVSCPRISQLVPLEGTVENALIAWGLFLFLGHGVVGSHIDVFLKSDSALFLGPGGTSCR